jgi:hypothetical protein
MIRVANRLTRLIQYIIVLIFKKSLPNISPYQYFKEDIVKYALYLKLMINFFLLKKISFGYFFMIKRIYLTLVTKQTII